MKKIRKFFHDYLGWGYPDHILDNDSVYATYTCQFCTGEITRDSQGNWFHLT